MAISRTGSHGTSFLPTLTPSVETLCFRVTAPAHKSIIVLITTGTALHALPTPERIPALHTVTGAEPACDPGRWHQSPAGCLSLNEDGRWEHCVLARPAAPASPRPR